MTDLVITFHFFIIGSISFFLVVVVRVVADVLQTELCDSRNVRSDLVAALVDHVFARLNYVRARVSMGNVRGSNTCNKLNL